MAKIGNAEQARALILDRIPADSRLRQVWETPSTTGATYTFLEITEGRTRVLWSVGPRGAVNRHWTYTADLWEALQ